MNKPNNPGGNTLQAQTGTVWFLSGVLESPAGSAREIRSILAASEICPLAADSALSSVRFSNSA